MNSFSIQVSINTAGYPAVSRSVNYSVSPTEPDTPVHEQDLTTSWEAINIGEISASAMGPCYFENLSETATLQLALANDNSQIFASLPPSTPTVRSFALIPLKTGTVYARAATGTLTFTSICTGL